MDDKKLGALADKLAKDLKIAADLNQFLWMLTKLTVETALNAELTDHLRHEKMYLKSASISAITSRQKRCSAMTARTN